MTAYSLPHKLRVISISLTIIRTRCGSRTSARTMKWSSSTSTTAVVMPQHMTHIENFRRARNQLYGRRRCSFALPGGSGRLTQHIANTDAISALLLVRPKPVPTRQEVSCLPDKCRRGTQSMDSGGGGLAHVSRSLGVCQSLWRLPDILHRCLVRFPIDDFLDRIRADVDDLRRQRFCRTGARCWSFLPGFLVRICGVGGWDFYH